MGLTAEQQYQAFLRILRGRKGVIGTQSEIFRACLEWLGMPHAEFKPQWQEEILAEMKAATGLSAEQLHAEIKAMQVQRLEREPVGEEPPLVNEGASIRAKMEKAQRRESELLDLLPREGFFRSYVQYTMESEAPLSYHVFSAMAALAATVNRRVHLDMGNHKLYPPFGVFILGPSGVKKTTAADIAISLLRESAITPIYAEKLTPEALIDGMRGGNATGIVYAPEMTVLISKQKYMESIIPLLTRFMDSPDIWNSGTIMRGKAELRDVAITTIMCSTIDWFVKNTPEALFGGGFIARNIMVMEEIGCRIKALPPAEDLPLRQKLLIDLARLHELQGALKLSTEAKQKHIAWYHRNKLEHVASNELFETYYARKPSHILRVAACLHLGTHWDLEVCAECWTRAHKLLEWVEAQFDLLGGKMFRSSYGEDQDLVLRAIEKSGGRVRWSDLLRRLSYRLSGPALKQIIYGLKDQDLVEEERNAMGHTLSLKKGVTV